VSGLFFAAARAAPAGCRWRCYRWRRCQWGGCGWGGWVLWPAQGQGRGGECGVHGTYALLLLDDLALQVLYFALQALYEKVG
jgi:hypothetical protein